MNAVEKEYVFRFKVVVLGNASDDTHFVKEALMAAEFSLFNIIEVDGLPEGVKYFTGDQIDAVLLDFHPGTEGINIIAKLKEIAPGVPLILLLDDDNDGLALHYIDMGVYDCIIKSETNRSQFVRCVEFAIKRCRKVKSLYERLQKLELVEETLRGIIEENTEPIIIVDANGIIRFINQSAEAIFGRKREGLEGEMFDFLISPRKTTEIEIVGVDGKKTLLEMRAIAIEWQKEAVYLVWLHNITGLVRLREELKSMSLIDELTGFFNQRGTIVLGEQQLKMAQRTKKGMTLIYVDFVCLEEINKRFGFGDGDAALIDIASILRDTFRKSDIIARIGNDEFVVLAIEADKNSDEAICFRLQNNVNKFNTMMRRRYNLSINIKTVYYNPTTPCSFDNLLAQAEG